MLPHHGNLSDTYAKKKSSIALEKQRRVKRHSVGTEVGDGSRVFDQQLILVIRKLGRN